MTDLNSNNNTSLFKIPTIKYNKLFINGHFVDSVSGTTFETIDPRTGEVIARISEGAKEDIDIAVKAAREAFDSGPWPRMSGVERAKIMMKFAELIDENTEELAALDAIDAGKLYFIAKVIEIPSSANTLRYYAGAADKIHGEVLKSSGEFHAYTLMEPIGVVGHIIPWNAPSSIFFTKVSPALAAGCTMVLKPAEQTPLSSLFYAHLAKLVSIRYGLAAGIVTKNLDIANTVSRSIRAGVIWINCYLALGSDVPFGGYKMSGFGRDLGLEALHKYLQVKSVVTPIYNSPWL